MVSYNYNNTYQSGWIHHVPLKNLKPSTTYYYFIGEDSNRDGANGLRYFTTMPAVGKMKKSLSFAVLADIGTTNDSVRTVNHILSDPTMEMVLHAGDGSYADCRPDIWDVYFNMIQDVAQVRPWMISPGNHEIEFEFATMKAFTAYTNRYRMPQVKKSQ